jgi:hypothetical protein
VNPASASAFHLRISLAEIDPPIWREVEVRSNATLHELHRIIQVIFTWQDYHLYDFRVSGRRFEAPDPEAESEDASRIQLRHLGLQPGDSFEYVYDFGDDWTHRIQVVDVNQTADSGNLPWLIDGARRGPLEDSGGPHRFMELLAALDRPLEDLEDDDRALVEWAGLDFDPEEFSVDQARHVLLLCASWGVLKRRG